MKKSIVGKLALLFVAIAWGSSMVVIKGSTDVLPPGTLLAWRFTIASVLLALMNIKKLRQIDRDYIKSGIYIGLCLFMAYFTQTIGVMLEMPAKSHFLSSAYCVFVPFLGAVILRDRPKFYHILAAVMCAAGIGLVSVSGSFNISFGDSVSIMSSVFWAAQIIAIVKWGKDKDPALITMLQFAVCAVFAWLFVLNMENPGAIQWNTRAIGGVLYLGVVCSGICFWLQTIAQKTEDPTSVSIILSFENIFGLIFGTMLFNEQFTVRSIVGFILIFSASIIADMDFSFLKRKKYRMIFNIILVVEK